MKGWIERKRNEMSTVVPYRPSPEILDAVADEIAARWGRAFSWPPQPLAIGLGPVILAALSATPPSGPPWQTMTYVQLESALGAILEAWTSKPRYWAATHVGAPRIGLCGEPLGKVLQEEADWARDRFRAAYLAGPLVPSPEQTREWIDSGRWVGLPGQIWSRPKLPGP
jgi:hypothetical protein